MPIKYEFLDRRNFLQQFGAAIAAAGVLKGAGEPELVDNPKGGFRFVKGGGQFSSGGARAMSGYEIVHVTFATLPPVRKAFEMIDSHLQERRQPPQALCGVELRCPHQFTVPDFAEFNKGYVELIANRGLLFGTSNSVARVNVTKEVDPPAEVSMYAFSYTEPLQASRPTFLLAATEEAGPYPQGIVARGDVSPSGIRQKLGQVLTGLDRRLHNLEVIWSDVTAVSLFTAHDVFPLMREVLLPALGPAGKDGVRWYLSRPPVPEVEIEMSVRGCRQELTI
jgi:hypothetical protein